MVDQMGVWLNVSGGKNKWMIQWKKKVYKSKSITKHLMSEPNDRKGL